MENINQEYPIDNNTLALFHFSENSGNIIHDDTGRYNGTCGSGVSWTNGKFGSAIHTDPSLGTLCDLDNLSFGNSMSEGTIELWFKADNEGFYGSLWGKEWGLYNRWKMYVSATNAIFEMRTGPPDLQSSIHDLNTDYSFSAGNWYHIAGTWGPEGMRIYVNGYLLSSNSYSGSSPNTYTPRPFTIGQFYSYMGREVNFTGIIDELRVSNVSRIYTEPSTCTAYSYSTMWGSRGAGDSQFGDDLGPRGIDVDNKGYVYAADYGNGWIKKFTINGDYAAKWSAGYISDLVYDGDFVYATNPSGYLIKYNINGSKIWEELIASPGWLLNGVTIDSEGIIQVANAYDSKIYKYYKNGTYMSSWGVFGNGSGQINEPWSAAADKFGYVYAGDNTRVQKFTNNGSYTGMQIYLPDPPAYDIDVDSDGNVFVATYYKIRKFDTNLSLLAIWGSQGSGQGQFEALSRIAVADDGYVYVSEGGNQPGANRRIQVFKPACNQLKITSPSANSSFLLGEGINVKFEIKDKNNNPVYGLSEAEYKIDSNEWDKVGVSHLSTQEYSFYINLPNITGTHTLNVRADIDGWVYDGINLEIPPMDLKVNWIKPIQVVENADYLVANKATVVRANITNTGPRNWITAYLYIDGAADYADYAVPIFTGDTIVDFYPGNSYIVEGKHNFTVAIDPNNDYIEINENNNNKSSNNVRIVKTNKLKIYFRAYNFNDTEKFEKAVKDHSDFIKATYPLSDIEIVTNSYDIPTLAPPIEDIPFFGVNFLTTKLLIENSIVAGADRVVGILPTGWLAESYLDTVDMCGTTPFLGTPIEKPAAVLVEPWCSSVGYNYHTTAHEIGHTYYLCEDYSQSQWDIENLLLSIYGGCGNSFPAECSGSCYGNSNISGFWVSEKKEMISKEDYPKFYTFMGSAESRNYSCPYYQCRWVNQESYNYLLNKFVKPESLLIDPIIILINGYIHKNGTIWLDEWYLMDGIPDNLTYGNYSILYFNSSKDLIYKTNFTASFYWAGLSDELNTTIFSFKIPFINGTTNISISYNGTIRASRKISDNNPIVNITEPDSTSIWSFNHTIIWNATDLDNDSLSYVLQYSSSNNYSVWYPLTIGVNQTNYTLNVGYLIPDYYKIRVIATDGVLTNSSISEQFLIKNPDIDVSPDEWSFTAYKGNITYQMFNITNTGNNVLTIFNITASNRNISLSQFNFPLNITNGSSLVFNATIDTFNFNENITENITINSNDPNEGNKIIEIKAINIMQYNATINISVQDEANINTSFIITALINNHYGKLTNANATLVLPDGLSTTENLTKNLANFSASEIKTVNWTVYANNTGLYALIVNLSSGNLMPFSSGAAFISIMHLEISNLTIFTRGNIVMINTTIKNLNSNVSYLNFYLNTTITDPSNNKYNISDNVSLLKAGLAETVKTGWDKTNKENGLYFANVTLYRKPNMVIDSKNWSFILNMHNIPLTSGWNLVSIPVNVSEKTLPMPLYSIEGNYSKVLSYNSSANKWLMYDPNNSSISNLSNIDEKIGVWIKMINNAALIINGNELLKTNFTLKQGWNLIGYPSNTTQLINETFRNVKNNLTAVFSYVDGNWLSYNPNKPPYLNTLKNMTPGHAYWIRLSQDANWTFNGTFNPNP